MINQYTNLSKRLSQKNIIIRNTITKLFGIEDSAKFLNMNEGRVLSLIESNELKYKIIKGNYYFDKNELIEWMFNQNPRLNEPLKINYNFSRN